MTCLTASAPGKVIVAGEYAVLDGAPAICMAVNRHARISISPSDDSQHHVTAPGYLATSRDFVSISEVADELPLLAAVWQSLPAFSAGFLKIDLDSSEFRDSSGSKIGLGSSAAVAVASTAALSQYTSAETDIRDTAMSAHREFQGGSGSGADIACSHAGGVIEYRMQFGDCPELSWPADLHYALLWSGQSADTATQLDKLAATESSASRMALAEAASVVASAWRVGDAEEISAMLAQYTDTLRRFDVDHRLGIFDAGHAELADTVADQVVYKPCGAGGGDLGIAVSTRESALKEFVAVAQSRQFEPLGLELESTGVVVTRNDVEGNEW
ncbi:MAG: mevalonate kinase family protein [Woeseiaceae bacterium]